MVAIPVTIPQAQAAIRSYDAVDMPTAVVISQCHRYRLTIVCHTVEHSAVTDWTLNEVPICMDVYTVDQVARTKHGFKVNSQLTYFTDAS